MLEDTSFSHVVSWNQAGDAFVVKVRLSMRAELLPFIIPQDMNEFTKSILPRMFKHSNFASFVRQLNKYDFHKVCNVILFTFFRIFTDSRGVRIVRAPSCRNTLWPRSYPRTIVPERLSTHPLFRPSAISSRRPCWAHSATICAYRRYLPPYFLRLR